LSTKKPVQPQHCRWWRVELTYELPASLLILQPSIGQVPKMPKKKAKASVKAARANKKAKAAPPAKKRAATAKKKSAPKKSARKVPQTPSLGRPTVTGEELLYMLFKEDFHARQIFEFLRVQTVKELEQFSPKEIIDRLSQPVRQSVDRIRRTLAERNRSLAGDEEFALKHKAAAQTS
jgi:hypothetical protein